MLMSLSEYRWCRNLFNLCVLYGIFEFMFIIILATDDMSHFPEQSRVRFVLEYPTPDGAQCPQLTETRPCTSLPRCIHYHWQVSTWSTCVFTDVNDQCGDHGYRIRGTTSYLLVIILGYR